MASNRILASYVVQFRYNRWCTLGKRAAPSIVRNSGSGIIKPHWFGQSRYASTEAQLPASSPKKPLLRRALTVVAIGVISSTAGFLVATVPSMSAANDLISPPSDVDTLRLYVSRDAKSDEINRVLTNHPIAKTLRQNPDFTESRPYFKIPESARGHFLTGGILSGPKRIWVPPLAFIEKGGKSLTIMYYLGENLSGQPGVIHEGLLAILLDEALARCSFGALPNNVSMTASLHLNHKQDTPVNGYYVARAELVKVEGRKAWVKGRLESAQTDGGAPIVYVEADGLFIEPKQAAAMKKLFPAATST